MNLKTNKLTAGLLAVILLLSVIPFSVPVSAAENEPVLTIGTPAELQAFADAVNSGESYEGKTVTLTANIDLGGESNPWTAIGTAANPFKGTFDGGYHAISGLYIASGSAVGLFGEVNGGTVQNLVVRGEVNGTSDVAGVIGKLTAGQVRNCGNEASVSGGANIGGVVGAVNGAGTVSGCYNKGTVSGTTGYIGGVTGQHWRAGRVENCYNAGTVTGPATVGGVTGGHKASSPVLEHCYNAGNVVDSPLSVQAAAAAPTATTSAAPEPTGNVPPLTRFPPHSWGRRSRTETEFRLLPGSPPYAAMSLCARPTRKKPSFRHSLRLISGRRSPVPGSRAASRAVCSATRSTFPASARPRPTGWRLPWGALGIGATARIPT